MGRRPKPDNEIKPKSLRRRELRKSGISSKDRAEEKQNKLQLTRYRNFLRSLDRRNPLFRRILTERELIELYSRKVLDKTRNESKELNTRLDSMFSNFEQRQVRRKDGGELQKRSHFKKHNLNPDGDRCPGCNDLTFPTQWVWLDRNEKRVIVGVLDPPRCLSCHRKVKKGELSL